jgi:CRP/FNR family transcriptional regulator
MFATLTSAAPAATRPALRVQAAKNAQSAQSTATADRPRASESNAAGAIRQRIGTTVALLNDHVAFTRRVLHAGDVIYQAGQAFDSLYFLHAGTAKTVNLASDGRTQVVGLSFGGDWLGFDGIAAGQYTCEAIAMDIGEVWVIRYDALIAASARKPALLGMLHEAMSREIAGDRDSLMSVCTLPADARVALFLRHWADSLAARGVRTDQITLRMTRAEIGNYLGMTLETVSRVLSRLARDKLICFALPARREVLIPDLTALSVFAQRCVGGVRTLQ